MAPPKKKLASVKVRKTGGTTALPVRRSAAPAVPAARRAALVKAAASPRAPLVKVSAPPRLHKGAPLRGAAAAAAALQLHHEVSRFLFHQSECLDTRRWQDYIDLFAADGLYWMPPGPEYTTWEGVPSIFIEDRDLMTVRMKRVTHPNAWSQQAEWGTSHVVSNVVVEEVVSPGTEIRVRSRFHMVELRRDEIRHFAGTYRHHLQRDGDSFKIKLQRVDMVNAQAPYEYVLQVWV